MDLARDQYRFSSRTTRFGEGAAPAGDALTQEILRDLLIAPDASRAELVAALRESTGRFDRLLSCVSGTFYRCELSPPWRVEFISPGIEEISGYPLDSFAEMPLGALILPEYREELDRRVGEAVADHGYFNVTYRLRRRDGELRWVHERGAAVYDDTGQPLFIEGFLSDVTEARRLEIAAEEARRESEMLNARMSSVLEHTLEGIVSFDGEWNYRFINELGARELKSPESLLGKNVFDVYPAFRQSEVWPMLRDVMARRKAIRGECRFDALARHFEVYAVPDGEGITAFFRNITDRKRLEAELVDSAKDLRRTLDTIPDMVWTIHPDGSGDYYNRSWNAFFGGEGSQASSVSAIHPEDRDRCITEWWRALGSGNPFETELRMRHHSGEYRWLLARAWPQRDESGAIVKWCGAATDIHERVLADRALRETQNLQSSILEACIDCIQIADLRGNLLFVNKPGLRAAGWSEDAPFVGKPWIELWPEPARAAGRKAFRQAENGKVVRVIERNNLPNGEAVWWDIIVSPIRDTRGEIRNVLCIARDVTEQREIAERLRVASEQDALTLLPNRRAFEKHLRKVTARAGEAGGNVALMLLDLDHFKHVNDTLGHLAGDHLLKVFARRLKTCVGAAGFVGRLGGDEFAIVLDQVRDDEELAGVAQCILSRIKAPVTFAGKPINGGLSIGCAVYPRDADDAQSLLQHSDTALYDLKVSGRGGIQMFSARMKEATERAANQLDLARSAIRDDAVEPYYQPKVRLETGEITGFEALLRWWSPGNGIQPPGSLAEAFNDYELSTKIGGLMQRRTFADMAEWLQEGRRLPPISINAAPAEFLRDDYAERLLDRLDEFRIPPSLIEVEITEHVFLERRSELIVRALEMLKGAGARIALDDFGTGHSSLSHLRDFPVDVLKIDRSFVSRMITMPRMLAIVRAIAKLGPSLSLDIVAEGVESPEQLHALRDAGCEFGQGYLFGRAMHSAEVSRRLATGNWPFRLRGAA